MYSDRLLGLERSGRALASADTRRFYHADLLPFPKREKVEVIIRQAQDSDDNEAWMQ
jgi:hypothetical protein